MKKSEKQILDSAIEVFTKNPNAAIEEVLQVSNISRATFYKYFDSKNAVIESLMLFSLDETERLLKPVFLSSDISNTEKLKIMFEVLIPMGKQFHFLNLFPEIFLKPNIQRQYDEQLVALLDILKKLKKEGVIKTDMPLEWVMEFCDSLIYAGWNALQKGTVAPQKISTYALQSFLNGINSDEK